MKAKLEHHTKVTDEYGNVMEIKVWKVPVTEHTPFGYKYSFVYVAGNERVVGYDNERGKGDHRHLGSKELPYRFTDIAELLRDFQADVLAFKRRVYES